MSLDLFPNGQGSLSADPRPVLLRRLRVRRFKALRDQTFEFSDGLNVVAGPNEAGKSTLHQALATALFGNPLSTSREREASRTWGDERLGDLVLHLEADGEPYVLRKDFEQRVLLLEHQGTGERWETRAEVERRLTGWLGFGSGVVFESVAFIDQVDMASIAGDREARPIEDSLSKVVTGGGRDADVEELLRRLERAIGDLGRGLKRDAPQNPGAVARLRDEIGELVARRDDLAKQSRQFEEQAGVLERTRERLAEAEAELGGRQQLLQTNLKIAELGQRAQALNAEEKRLSDLLKKIDENLSRLTRIEEDLRPPTAGAEVHDEAYLELVKAEEAVRQKAELADRLEKEAEEGQRRTSGQARAASGSGASGVAVSLGLLLAAVGFALAAMEVSLPLGLVVFLLGVGVAAWGMWIRQEAHGAAAAAEARQTQIGELRRRAAEARTAAEQARKEFQGRLAYFGSDSLGDLRVQHRLRQERAALESHLEALTTGTTREAIDEQLRRTSRELLAIEGQLADPAIRSAQLPPLEFQTLQREVKALTDETAELRTKKTRAEGMLEGVRSAHEEVSVLEERLEDLGERMRREQRRLAILEEVRTGLLAAREQTIVPARAVLEDLAGAYLAQATGGRYGRVRVEEGTLRFGVYVGGPKEWAAPDELSRGAQDQCYLAARLALIRVLAQGRRPPVFLDDPFVTFDDERQAAAMRMVAQIAQDQQVFLFTCRPPRLPDGATLLRLEANAARQAVP